MFVLSLLIYCIEFYDPMLKPVVHNVRPAGQIRPATSLDVARDVQQK